MVKNSSAFLVMSFSLSFIWCNAFAAGTVLFEDFEDGVADGFTEVGDAWDVDGGVYLQFAEDPPGPYRSWVNAGEFVAYTVEVDCTPLFGEETKVIYAHGDSGEDYRVDFWLDSSRLCMPAWGDGWDTRNWTVGELNLSYGETFHVRIEVNAAFVIVWVNDVLQHEQPWANEESLGDGKVGVGTYAATATFDNFSVHVGEPGPIPFVVLDSRGGEEGTVRLTWSNLGPNFLYTVEFCDLLTEGTWSPVPPIEQWPTDETTWTDTTVARSATRFYRIHTEARFDPPSPPFEVDATGTEEGAIIHWGLSPGAFAYNVYWSTEEDLSKFNSEKVEDATAPFIHPDLTPGTTYYYAVAAVGNKGESELSRVVRVGPPPAVDRVLEATQALQRYHFRLSHRPGVIYDGEIDLLESRQYVQVGESEGEFPQSEAFWEDGRGYGRRLEHNQWLKMRNENFHTYLQSAADMLRSINFVSIGEDGPFWLLSLEPEHLPILDDPEQFWHDLVEQLPCPCGDEFLERAIEMTRDLRVSIRVRVSKEDFLIHGFTVRSAAGEKVSEMVASFSPSQMAIPPLPGEALEADTPEIPPAMLLFKLDTIGGWIRVTHTSWAQRTLQLIKDEDTYGQYAEMYHPSWSSEDFDEKLARKVGTPDHTKHHPLVLGAHYEDHGDPLPQFYHNWFASWPEYQKDPLHYFDPKYPSGYERSYHHYGADANGYGVEYHWYYKFHNPPPTTKTNPSGNKCYYSGCDWGYGCDRISPHQWLNSLTFADAIWQYNWYTKEGKRNAYLILGHVVHLLQDQGHGDHVLLVPHAGSSKDETEVKPTYCLIMAGEAALVAAGVCSAFGPLGSLGCGGAAFLIAKEVCDGFTDPLEMGYEALIGKEMLSLSTPSWELKNIDADINATGVLDKANYNAYFADIGSFTKTTLSQIQQKYPNTDLSTPLGLGSLTIPPLPTVPGLDPDINTRIYEKEVWPFYDLTNKIVPRVIGLSAGLMQDFFDIVNYPPYVKRFAIVQWEAGKTPTKFAFFADDKDHCLRYDAEWQLSGSVRTFQYHTKPPANHGLSPDRPAYVFIVFGPAKIGPDRRARTMDLQQTELRVTGIYPVTGDYINEDIALMSSTDPTIGPYYWGEFLPRNCGDDPYELTFVIQGKDNGPHFSGRQPSGDETDAQPGTIAIVDPCQANYPWQYYEPGPDARHKIKVSPIEWTYEVNPQPLVINPSQNPMGEVTLEIKQRSWDCNWEPDWDALTCPSEWSLIQVVTKQGTPPQTGLATDFGFEMQLTLGRIPGQAILEISVAGDYTPGDYEVEVLSKVGEPGHEYGQFFYISVEIL